MSLDHVLIARIYMHLTPVDAITQEDARQINIGGLVIKHAVRIQ